MGSFSANYSLEGRTVNDFGLAFSDLKNEKIERFYVIQVRPDGTLFDAHMFTFGQKDRVDVDMHNLARYIEGIVEHGFVVLHNHPPIGGGPSKADWTVTKDIAKVAKAMGKVFYNHCVVSTYEDYYLMTIGPEFFRV